LHHELDGCLLPVANELHMVGEAYPA